MQKTTASTTQEEATRATARACHGGYRRMLARRMGVSATAIDMVCTMPERCPLAKVVKMHAHLSELGAPDPDAMVRALCELTGHFPPVKRGRTPAEEIIADYAPAIVEAHERLTAEADALAPAVAVAMRLIREPRHGPRPTPLRQKHERPREQVAGGVDQEVG